MTKNQLPLKKDGLMNDNFVAKNKVTDSYRSKEVPRYDMPQKKIP